VVSAYQPLHGPPYNPSSVYRSYSTGMINAYGVQNPFIGGIVGRLFVSHINRCFFDIETSEVSVVVGNNNGGTVALSHGIPSWSMKLKHTYNMYDWDMENIWDISPNFNHGYPLLRGLYDTYIFVDFIADPMEGNVPLEVYFTDLSVGAVSWSWDFDSDGVIDSTEQNPIFIYEESGTYTVTLTINDGENSITKEDYIVVLQPAIADFTAEITQGNAPLEVQFMDMSVGAVSWSWDFGVANDGNRSSLHKLEANVTFQYGYSTEQNPTFIYEEPGTYTVTLTINDGEDSITKEDYIVVVQPAIADFTAEITQGNAPLEVQFMDMSVGAVSWEWDFGVANDGNRSSLHKLEANVTFQYGYSTEQNPIFIYEEPGTYTVTLTINDGESIITKENFIEATLNDMEGESLPLVTQLKNNFPNPFNPETTISFSLKTAGHVRLEIFNVRGQKVKVLVNDFKEIGSHSVVWNGTDDIGQSVGSGMYFYLMSTDGYSGVKRMILLK